MCAEISECGHCIAEIRFHVCDLFCAYSGLNHDWLLSDGITQQIKKKLVNPFRFDLPALKEVYAMMYTERQLGASEKTGQFDEGCDHSVFSDDCPV
jgi:hypothetical protein